MYSESTEGERSYTLAENIQASHRLLGSIEDALHAAQGVLSGVGSSGTAIGADKPSSGLLGDARSLTGRLERVLTSLSALNDQLSAAPRNVVEYPTRTSGRISLDDVPYDNSFKGNRGY